MKNTFTLLLILLGLSTSGQLYAQQVEDVVSGLSNPFGLALNAGELYISSQNAVGGNTFAGQITKIDPAAANPSPEIFAQVEFSTSMAVHDGFLYVTDISSIQKIDLSAVTPSPEIVLSNLGFPNGLLVIDDELYFCQTTAGTVDKIDLSSGSMPTVTPVVTQDLSGPIALEHRDGILYIAESDNQEVSSVNLGDANPTPTPLVTGLTGILDITFDGDFLYAAVLDGVARFNPSETTPSAELFINNLDAPHGVLFVEGVLHVTEFAMGKVIRITQISPSWSSPSPVCANVDSTRLGGASPTGGVYSGTGVTDNGDGETFTFDATATVPGTNTVTYTKNGQSVDVDIEVIAAPTVTFTPSGPFMTTDGLQPLTGGMPASGTYSGEGVVDNGDGTYSFDPAVGAGIYTVTYSYTDANGCSASASEDILVEEVMIDGDLCTDAVDINSQFGQASGETQSSGPYDNTNATTDASDPEFGWECFGEPDGGGGAPSLERTLWYTFEGDGNRYFIEALACGDDPIDFSDTQFAIYAGSCDALVAVLCNEDGPNTDGGAGYFPAGDTLQTESGVTYYMMVDGFGPDFVADGEFCIEVANLTEPVELTTVTFQVDASLLVEDGTISADGIYLAGGFNDFNGEPMSEGTDNIWTLTLEIEPGTYTYKFQNGPGGWENIDTGIGDDCTVGGYGDREVVVEDMDITAELVCFGYCVTCDMVVDTDEAALRAGISVFPNPAREVLNVRVGLPQAAKNLSIRLINALGQAVSEQYLDQSQQDNIELDLSNVPAGTYMLQVRDGASQYTEAVIVQ